MHAIPLAGRYQLARDIPSIREISMKKLIAVVALMFATVAIAGCNTFAGMGKDVERGGEKLQDSANNVKQRM